MELHERQQFDFLLMTAVERFVERLEQRHGGAGEALALLRRDSYTTGILLDEFVSAMFRDFLLDNIAGACFVLQALPQRTAPEPGAGSVEAVLIAMAKTAFADLLKQKTEEALEQHLAFQASNDGGRP